MAVNGVTENAVVELWQKMSGNGCEMLTEDGHILKVLYAGRISDEPGGDLKDAVIELGNKLIRGNIEFHIHSRDWQVHGHHRDPAYNKVVLHVVMWHDAGDVTFQENRLPLPMVALAHYSVSGVTDTDIFHENCLPCTPGGEFLIDLLEAAGENRFREKADNFARQLQTTGTGECLYQGMMEALGYSRNKDPFLRLAKAIPLKMLESLRSIEMVQAFLLGSAGLLPSQHFVSGAVNGHDTYIEQLENIWRESNFRVALPRASWQFFKVRPGNHPVRRLVGMSYL